MAEQLGTEPDADLTMIQPEKTSTDLAYEDLVNSAKDRSAPEALTQAPTTAGEAMNRIGSLQDAQSVNSSMRAGNVDPDLDRGKSMFESVESARARNQNNGVKALKAIGGGILQGGLIVAEEAGYVIDMDTYTNLFTDTEDLSGNAWTRLMKETQESLRESEAFKIYEDQPDPNSVTSQIFKWGSLEGAISSAVGFGVTGLGAAKLVSYLGTAKKFKDLARYTDLTMGSMKGDAVLAATKAGGGMTGATKAFVGPLATSAMSNYFMGQMMGTDTYNQAMIGLEGEIKSGRMTEREAQELASNEAQDVVALNMALSATAYIKFGGIFKRKGRFNGLVENPTALNQMKNLIKAGSPTAFTENVYQEMIQMEQLYDVDKRAGIENASSDNYWDRMTNLAMSNRALHAGALGVVGGPIQFAVIQRPMMGKQIEEQRKAYKEQTALVGTKKKPGGWNKSLVDNNFQIFRQYEDMAKTALVKGEFKEAEFIDDVHVLTQLSKNVEWGTSSILRKDMEDISKMTPEEAAEQNYGEDYKEVAASMLETLDRVDMYTKAYTGASNKGEIIHNRIIADRTTKELKSIEKAVGDNIRAIGEELKTKFPGKEIGIEEVTGNISISRLPGRFEGLSAAKAQALKVKEATENSEFESYLKHSHKVKDYFKGIKGIKKYTKFKNDLKDHYDKITNPEYQAKFAKEQATATKNAKNKAGEIDSIVAEQEEGGAWLDFKELEAQPPRYTKEALEEQQKQWDKEAKASKNINRNESFSAMDPNGVVRTYTPGDLVRSQDGRVFKIVKQVMTKTKSGQERFNMPLIREVTDEGKWIKDAPIGTILEDNMFLRDEAKQLVYNKAGVPMKYHEKTWGQYLKTDSLLKANDVNYQASLLKYADQGQVVGINVSANRMKSGDFKWMDDYDHHSLNLPFPGEYEVVYKLNKIGEEYYIDVFKKNKGKAADVKITRLSREGNLNHQALLNLLVNSKGEITGKAVGHYSSRANLLKNYGEDGKPIFSPLADLNNIDPSYLINGKMIIAQTKGDGPNVFPRMNVARDSDGKVYAEEYIDVKMPDGTTVTKDIPFTDEYGRKIMQPGDSYALILSPQGEIVPLLLSAEKIQDMPSMLEDGESFIDDVTASWNEAIQTWLADEIANEEATDLELKNDIKVDTNVVPDKRDEVFADRKAQKVWEKKRDTHKKDEKDGGAGSQYSEFKKTILTHIRLGGSMHTVVGYNNKKEKIFNVNKKKERIVNPSLLRPGITVAIATGKYVPSIEVQHPTTETKTQKYNPIDNPVEWKKIIGRQRKRTSIDLLADTSLSDAEGKAAMQNLITAGGLKVDVDTTTPYVGSSLTTTVTGEDFAALSADVGQNRRKYLRKAFKGFEEVKEVLVEATDTTLENFNEDIDSVLTEENPWLKETINEVDEGDIKDVVRQFEDKVIAMDIVQQRAALEMLNKIMGAETVEAELQAEYDKIIEQLEDRGIGNNQDAVAKGILGLRKVQDTINDKKSGMILKDKQRLKSDADPTGKHTQPENRIMSKGLSVYHAEFGAAVFDKIAANGMYQLRTVKNNRPVKAYPGDTFIHNGDRAALAKAKHEIARVDETKNVSKFKALKEKIVKLELKVIFSNKVKADPTVSPGDSKIFDLYTELRSDKADLDAVKLWGSSDRTKVIYEALSDLKESMTAVTTGEAFTLTEEVAVELNKALVEAIPYQAEDLQVLLTQVDVKITENGKNVEQYKAWKSRIKSLIAVQAALSKGSTVVRTKIEGERYVTSKQSHAPQFFYAPSYKEYDRNNKIVELESLQMVQDMGAISRLVQRVTIAEANLQATHFAVGTTVSVHQAPINAENVKNTPIVAKKEDSIDEILEQRRQTELEVTRRQPVKKAVKEEKKVEEEAPTTPTETLTDERNAVLISVKEDENGKVTWTEGGKINTSSESIGDVLNTLTDKYQKKIDEASGIKTLPQPVGFEQFIVPDAVIRELMDAGEATKEALLEDLELADLEDQDLNKVFEQFIKDREVPFKRGEDVSNSPEAFEAEVKQVKAMLPQISIEQVESVTAMVNKFGAKAIGAYDQGVAYIVRNAKAGTLFHEGFHAVASLYLTSEEKAAMAKEKGESKWTRDLEETLADDFAVFAKDRKAPGIGDRIKKFFQSILDWFTKTRSADITTKIFEKIVTKGYAKSRSLNWQENVSADFNSISTYKERLSKKNSVLLQTLIDTNKIEIVC